MSFYGFDEGTTRREEMRHKYPNFKGKSVFDASQCIHVWAQQRQPHGSNAKASVFFDGATLYSYGYHYALARIVTSDQGERVVLINSESSSVTTEKHKGYVHSATRNLTSYRVPHIEGRHPDNFRHLCKLADLSLEAARNTRRKPENRCASFNYAQVQRDAARTYLRAFASNIPHGTLPDLPNDYAALAETIRKLESERDTRDAAKQVARRASAEKAAADALPVFLSTGSRALNVAWHDMPCYLAVAGEEIVTSWGARFPATHGIKALRLICAARKAGRAWTRNGVGPRLGHFQIDAVSADGTVKAGCHVVAWTAIEHAARQLGLI